MKLGFAFTLAILVVLLPCSRLSAGLVVDKLVTVEVGQRAAPPEWALLERHVLEQLYPAALEFVHHYTAPDGSLIFLDKFPGADGSDDAYESFYNFPLYYALGGPEEMNTLSRKLWDGITRQWTGYGRLEKEFDAYYDWMHHGESYTNFYFFGLADPSDALFRERALRFAGFYLNEDPEARNYDSKLKLIRSPWNGSRGPLFKTTPDDWPHYLRLIYAEYLLPFEDMPGVTSPRDWLDDKKFPIILDYINKRMMSGDVPLNLTATSLVANAYMYTGDPKYKQWIKEYVEAWQERLRRNNGIMPDNVGLSGKIGENMDGKWWGGLYGWRWSHGLETLSEPAAIGASNAYLVTGDPSYLDMPRSVMDLVISKGEVKAGQLMVPHQHGDKGWFNYHLASPQVSVALWYWSSSPSDMERIRKVTQGVSGQVRVGRGSPDAANDIAWLNFISGKNPEYPRQILEACYAETLRRLEMIRTDRIRPSEMGGPGDVDLPHHWQVRNPVRLEGLVHLMLGAPDHIYHGGLLHASVRYFDPERRRPGVPPDVAALVDRVSGDSIRVNLANVNPVEPRTVILEAGMFGEHQFTEVSQEGNKVPVNGRFFQVRLRPGTTATLEMGMKRYSNQPTYAFPW